MDRKNSNGSIAHFSFESYKINKLNIQVEPIIDLLLMNTVMEGEISTEFKIGMINPTFFESKSAYVSGLAIKLDITSNDNKKLAEVDLNIIGYFQINNEERLSEKDENVFLKIQSPAILFPYARAAISASLSLVGLPSIFLPVINFTNIFNDTEIEVKII